MLDAGPLGRLSSPKPHADIVSWLDEVLSNGADVYVSEVADYEVRRNLLLHNKQDSIRRLEDLNRSLIYLPISTSVMLKAAELWAVARRRGRPTADLKELDCDVILGRRSWNRKQSLQLKMWRICRNSLLLATGKTFASYDERASAARVPAFPRSRYYLRRDQFAGTASDREGGSPALAIRRFSDGWRCFVISGRRYLAYRAGKMERGLQPRGSEMAYG